MQKRENLRFSLSIAQHHGLVCSKVTQICGDQTGISHSFFWRHLPMLCVPRTQRIETSNSWLTTPNVSTHHTMHLPAQWPVQARDKMPPGAEGSSYMSSGADFGTNSNFKNLKSIYLAVSWKRDLTLRVCKPFKRSSKWRIFIIMGRLWLRL